MNLLCQIDQKKAIRRGIDATSSTVKLDVHPGDLPEDLREIMADMIEEGYKLTGNYRCLKLGKSYGPIYLVTGTVDELVGELERIKSAVQADMKEKMDSEASKAKRMLANPPTRRLYAVCNADGDPAVIGNRFHSYDAEVEIKAPGIIAGRDWDKVDVRLLPSDLTEKVRSHDEEAKAETDKLKSEALLKAKEKAEKVAERRRKRERLEAEREEREAKEFDALYARLPETMRERHQAGFASDYEINDAIENLIIEDLGIKSEGVLGDTIMSISTLTDEEFEAYKDLKETVGEFADVQPVVFLEDHFDEFGDFIEHEVIGNGFEVTARRAGLTAKGYFRADQQQ